MPNAPNRKFGWWLSSGAIRPAKKAGVGGSTILGSVLRHLIGQHHRRRLWRRVNPLPLEFFWKVYCEMHLDAYWYRLLQSWRCICYNIWYFKILLVIRDLRSWDLVLFSRAKMHVFGLSLIQWSAYSDAKATSSLVAKASIRVCRSWV